MTLQRERAAPRRAWHRRAANPSAKLGLPCACRQTNQAPCRGRSRPCRRLLWHALAETLRAGRAQPGLQEFPRGIAVRACRACFARASSARGSLEHRYAGGSSTVAAGLAAGRTACHALAAKGSSPKGDCDCILWLRRPAGGGAACSVWVRGAFARLRRAQCLAWLLDPQPYGQPCSAKQGPRQPTAWMPLVSWYTARNA